jgi:hypothetical protein
MDRAKLFRESAARANEGRDRNGWRYTAALRRLAVEYCHSCRRSHQRFSEIADSLGVSTVTLGRWLEKERGATSPGFREVIVEPTALVPEAGHLTVLTPSGLRIEGLDLSGVVELARALL